MTYQGFVARQMNKERWRNQFIGVTSISNEKESLESEMHELTDELNKIRNTIILFEDANKMEVINSMKLKQFN